MRKLGSLLAASVMVAGGIAVLPPETAQASSCTQSLGISVAPNPVSADGRATATVRLHCRLGRHGTQVTVEKGWSGYATPTSVYVPAHSNSASFTVSDRCTSHTESHLIQVRLGKLHAKVTLTAKPCSSPPTLTGFAITPANVVGLQTATGTVTLSAPAPAHGYVVQLNGQGYTNLPASITVPAGARSASVPFQLDAADQHFNIDITLYASAGGVTLGAPFSETTHTPIMSTAWVKGPGYFRDGHPGDFGVTLTAPAVAGGTVVDLAVVDAQGAPAHSVTVPASVTIPAGSTTADVPVTANPVTQNTTVYIEMTAYGVTKYFRVTVEPPGDLDSISSPNLVAGTSNTGRVLLSYPEPTDTVVQLSTSDPLITVPATVTVPAGQTAVGFPITVGQLPQPEVATITATLGSETLTVQRQAGPNKVSYVWMQGAGANQLPAGTKFTGYVTLWSKAPAGTDVTLTSSDPQLLSVPATIQVPARGSRADFTATALGVLSSGTSITITATWNGSSATHTLTVP